MREAAEIARAAASAAAASSAAASSARVAISSPVSALNPIHGATRFHRAVIPRTPKVPSDVRSQRVWVCPCFATACSTTLHSYLQTLPPTRMETVGLEAATLPRHLLFARSTLAAPATALGSMTRVTIPAPVTSAADVHTEALAATALNGAAPLRLEASVTQSPSSVVRRLTRTASERRGGGRVVMRAAKGRAAAPSGPLSVAASAAMSADP
jgi:hypothetical protein